MGWRIDAAGEFARIRAAWPATTVAGALELLEVEVEAEALDWANQHGGDFIGAWHACPRGDWLYMLALALAAGVEETRIPDHVARGLTEVTLTAASGSADEVRRHIDGPALVRASLTRIPLGRA